MTQGQSQQFQVDLRGVVDLLSRHIYSSPRVFLRELLQNARDAIIARHEHDAGRGTTNGRGSIRIHPVESGRDEFVVTDDGVGLTSSEVGDLLATVGRSSKRDIFDLPRSDYLGQFGIGLLSCFMVADEILIRSRSARGGAPVEWRGLSDGTFTVQELSAEEAAELPIGTSVHLRPRAEHRELLKYRSIRRLAETFAEFLPVDVSIALPDGGYDTITSAPPFLEPASHPDETVAYGTTVLGTTPFDVIPLSAPGTGTEGVAYVLPFAPPPGARQATRVYLGRMLLAERVDDILPEWAFFVRAVVDSTSLSPTASRESLVDDEALEHTREQFGAAIRRWVLDLGLTQPHRLQQFVAVHELGVKSLVTHDDELARFMTRWLSLETTMGRMTIDQLTSRFPQIRYAETVDEFRQLASLHRGNAALVNGGYVYDSEILRLLPQLFDGVTVERVDVVTELDRLDPPPLDDRATVVALEERANAVLEEVDCRVSIRAIDSIDIPAIYVADPEVLRAIDRSRTKGITGSLWGGVLDKVDRLQPARDDADLSARLCLNWSNRVIRSLARVDDDVVFSRTVHLLYIQALLAGQRPLAERDRALMTTALSDLVALSAGVQDPFADADLFPEDL